MNNKRIALGIGIVLLVFAVFTVQAAAHRAYFVPQDSSATTGNTTTMEVFVEVDAGENLGGGQLQIQFDPTYATVIENYALCEYVNPTGPDQYCWGSFNTNFESERNGYMWGGVSHPLVSKEYDPPGPDPFGWYYVDTEDGLIHGPVTVSIGLYVIEASGTPGISPFDFGFEHFPEDCPACQKCKFVNGDGLTLPMNWENGTFTHEGEIPSETFTKSLPEGWNLISLPLTPTDNSVSEVLSSVSQNAVRQYDATTHQFEDATTMDPGTGYFVNVTNACTWEYEGEAYTSMTESLLEGLNCVGWVNETGSALPDALSSIDGSYWYVSRWNADTQSYEVYNPNAPDVFNDFETMDRGEGYFISATNGCTLTYP
ncbi:MAG: hypothetical protein ACT6FF_08050 [Methanosarcinaceae archaeon]